MKKILLAIVMAGSTFFSASAQKNPWSANNASRSSIVTDKAVARPSFPKEFKLFDLQIADIRQQLFAIAGKESSKHSAVISLPNANGQIEQFEVVEASNFEPALQAQFPEIRAYSGKGVTDKSATLKLSISPQGVQTMVFRTEQQNEFIEAYSQDHKVYAVFRAERKSGQLPWACSTEDNKLISDINMQVVKTGIAARSGGDLKTLRLAQSCNAEYSNYFGATSSAQVALVLAAYNATLTRCNGVYEKDLALHLNLIANTTLVIYYNKATDPYSASLSSWNSQLQSTLTSVIGEANYDIGHMFGASGGGGNAGCIGCVCVNGSKGSGITSPADAIPQGDNFDIDYVVHEVGHQLGANHTFSNSNEGTGVNKEIGSGITIMGYAGITTQDVAAHSIDIFHEASIAQIQTNLGTKTCPVTTTLVNATPVIAALTNYTIPISTPFALTGSATDADASDVLTYCWEQNDNASGSQTGSNSRASATKASGPNWISFPPVVSPTRYFPKLATILAGGTTSGPLTGGDAGVLTEALSSVSRTLNFRLTVRDNAPYSSTSPVSVGQTSFKDMVVTVSNTSGPFSVSSPNTNVTWAESSAQTITWNVASSNLAPVSCATVNILLSKDGGNTFPTVLATATANDGSQVVTLPAGLSTTARIKVESVGNIFFDISNTNFTIGSASGCNAPTGLSSSAVTASSATVSWSAASGAVSYDADYKATSSGTWINAATATTGTSVNLSSLAASTTYDYRVRTNCVSGSSSYASAQFTTSGASSCPVTYDLGNNNNFANAVAIPFNTDVNGLINITTDKDFYRFDISTGGTITITLTALPANFDIVLYNSGQAQVANSTNTGTTSETINYTAAAGTYYVRVKGFQGAVNTTLCYTLKVATGTASKGIIASDAIVDSKSTGLKVYPNPVQSFLNISLPKISLKEDIKVYDANGRMVISKKVTETNIMLDVKHLTKGVYFIKVTDENGEETYSTRFMKQ